MAQEKPMFSIESKGVNCAFDAKKGAAYHLLSVLGCMQRKTP